MTLLGWVRHGVTDWNQARIVQGQTDVPLNAAGIMQAQALAERLIQEQWDLIYTSDLARARATAEMIASRSGLPVLMDERLREMYCGLIEGTTHEERVAKWGTTWKQIEPSLGVENVQSIQQRGAAFALDMAARYPGKRIIVVSHGGLIARTLEKLIPHHSTSEHLQNTSITKTKHLEGQWNCELYNCTMHLADFTAG